MSLLFSLSNLSSIYHLVYFWPSGYHTVYLSGSHFHKYNLLSDFNVHQINLSQAIRIYTSFMYGIGYLGDKVAKGHTGSEEANLCLYFANKGLSSQSDGFSSSPVWMWELDYKESWVPKNWCFWIVVLEKTLVSPLGCREIKPVYPKGNQSWIFIGRTDARAETSVL